MSILKKREQLIIPEVYAGVVTKERAKERGAETNDAHANKKTELRIREWEYKYEPMSTSNLSELNGLNQQMQVLQSRRWICV